jgi:hypothetical protein
MPLPATLRNYSDYINATNDQHHLRNRKNRTIKRQLNLMLIGSQDLCRQQDYGMQLPMETACSLQLLEI